MDDVLQIWNEVIHEMYGFGALVGEVDEESITLETDVNDYDLPDDFEAPINYRWPEYVTTARGEEWWIPEKA